MDLISYKLSNNYTDEKASIQATNLIEDGNFENGTSGWTGRSGKLSANENILTYTTDEEPLRTSSNSFVDGSTIEKTTIGNKYFVSVEFYPKYSAQFRYSIGGQSPFFTSVVGNEWNKRFDIITATSSSGYFYLFHDFARSGYVVGDSAQLKNVITIDLTETFGAGNEPTSSEMNEILTMYHDGWFDVGELLTIKDIFNYYLIKIRELNNAVTNLGGGTT